ncbi:von Willebrand factor D and EGF domain-containing protein-like [Mercenaria mercenaria]|uniref:von Willebrand factor D and EGF domain-containing protein-like n=1 Tax=Mercenaria mercenaria TaxID=6596 RepID=UPI00234E9EAE|nr:von Willebrand factor D and EGF domain-containing protein-like [Mercenaria mercenaria]
MISFPILLALFSSAFSLDPCTQNKVIDEKYRSSDYYIKDKGYEHMICDRTLAAGWYKFAGGKEMTHSCTKPYHCGTHIPLWINGTKPTVSDGIVNRQVCGTHPTSSDCCLYKDTIRVKNCGTFYAYELKPTRGCSYAYCAGNGVPCPPDKWSATGYEPGCVDMFPKMLNNPSLSYPIVKPDTFEFKCHVNFDASRSDVGFDVQWYFDNKTDASVPDTHLSGTQRDAVLDQKYLAGHLGESLSCRVRSYFKATPFRKGPYLPSNGYWCGIKYSPTSLTVSTKDPAQTVKLISTIPIICDKAAQPSCKLELYLDNNNHNTVTTTSCTKVMKPTDWNAATHESVIPVQILAQRDPKKDADKNLALHFQQIFSGDAPPIFNGYNIPYLPIHTKDKDTSQCRCTGDPHCVTLDTHLTRKGAQYDYYKVGEFMMYESTVPNRLFQVQARTWSCGRVTCNCGVAAREGNDIVIIDMCHGHYGKSFPQVLIPHKGALSQGTVVSQDPAGNHFLIDFPSGAQVKVDAYKGRLLNIYITSPEDDFGATQGLCGTLDGNRDNDLKHPDGTTDTFSMKRFQPNSFVESWRIPIGSSMFDLKENIPVDRKYNNDIYYCNCDQKKSLVDCTFDNNKNLPAVHTRCGSKCNPVIQNGHINLQALQQAGRKKRSASGLDDDNAPVNYFFDYGLSFAPQLRNFPTENGKTQADAEKACRDAFSKHSTIQQCTTHAGMDFSSDIDECVEDFKYFDDGSFVSSAIDSALASCVATMSRNASCYGTDGKLPDFISTDRCPSDCSNQGTCVHGTCHCHTGYVGDGCEINSRQPPELYNVITSYEDSVLCDVTMRLCETVYMAGSNIFNNSKLSCRIEEFKFDGTGFVATGRHFTTGVVYDNMYHVGCKLPAKSTVGGYTVISYNISVTNDARHYSNEVKVVKTDSTCLNCRDDGLSCQIQAGMCLIDGNCRQSGELNKMNHNQKCDPAKSNKAWTSLSTGIDTGSLPTAPLGGIRYKRFDIWTRNKTGCPCAGDATSKNCACCDDGGCQCPAPNQHQCTLCGSTQNCGTPQPGPDMGIDGYTTALADCPCKFDKTKYNCACCQEEIKSCQCGPEHRNQCVACDHMDHCGNKPWIFGPPMPNH